MAEKDLYLKIGRPNNCCAACGVEIAYAGRHPSVLRTPEDPPVMQDDAAEPASSEATGLPRRDDYCAECWAKVGDHDFLGFWVTRREPPKVRKITTRKERNAGVLAWFDHLRSRKPDEETAQALFFLAHLLMKYGALKWLRTEEGSGEELIVFRQVGSDEEVSVAAVDLTEERSEEIKRELDDFLVQYANSDSSLPPAPAEDPSADHREAEPESEVAEIADKS